MNRFESSSISPIKYIGTILPIAFFIAIVIFFMSGIRSVSESTREKQKESLETALEHSIAQCYAVEGHYPSSLSYITDHYGLTYDSDTFLVNYTYYGGNLYPDISVIYKTGKTMR